MMVVAAMQGADQHQEQFEVQYLAQGLRHADQENRTQQPYNKTLALPLGHSHPYFITKHH